MTCILHKLWSSYLFFEKSVSFPPFWLKFPWIFQNDQVLGNPFHVVCFIFKGGRGICVVEKPTSNVKSFPKFFTGSSHFQVSFHDWHFEEHHVWSSSQKTRVWLKELAWKAQFVSLFPQNKIAHLVCSLLPFRTGWHCGKGGFSSCLLKSLWLCLFYWVFLKDNPRSSQVLSWLLQLVLDQAGLFITSCLDSSLP